MPSSLPSPSRRKGARVLSGCASHTGKENAKTTGILTSRELVQPTPNEPRDNETEIVSGRIWHLYVLQCKDGSLYCGIALDVQKRFAQHQNGKGAKYTRSRRPVTLLDTTSIGPDMAAALKAERQFKALPRARKLAALKNRAPSPGRLISSTPTPHAQPTC